MQQYWFPAHPFGYGWGLGRAWQGWAVSLALIGLILLAYHLFGNDDWRALAIVVPAVLFYVLIAAWTTKGG